MDGKAAGWPGTESRDWIPEMRQTDGTPNPLSSSNPPDEGKEESVGNTLCSPR